MSNVKGSTNSSDYYKLWSKVHVPSDECWEWKASLSAGYGQLRNKGRIRKAHQMVHEIFFGPTPPGLQVLHTCDNRKCCNPFHLWLGTHDDNMRDMRLKNRCGSPRSMVRVLNRRQVRAVRRRYKKNKLTREYLAQQYKVSGPTIDRIIDNITYTHESYYDHPSLSPRNKHPSHPNLDNRGADSPLPGSGGAAINHNGGANVTTGHNRSGGSQSEGGSNPS